MRMKKPCRGGYAGIGAPDPNERNIELHETVLSGDLLGDDPDIADTQALVNAPGRLDNSLHVVTIEHADTCVIDGFTIRGGHGSPVDRIFRNCILYY